MGLRYKKSKNVGRFFMLDVTKKIGWGIQTNQLHSYFNNIVDYNMSPLIYSTPEFK